MPGERAFINFLIGHSSVRLKRIDVSRLDVFSRSIHTCAIEIRQRPFHPRRFGGALSVREDFKMKFRVRYAPQNSPVKNWDLLSFEEECDLLEVWGPDARRVHKERAASAAYLETPDGAILEIVHEPEDTGWTQEWETEQSKCRTN
jgi:hypothetical protein